MNIDQCSSLMGANFFFSNSENNVLYNKCLSNHVHFLFMYKSYLLSRDNHKQPLACQKKKVAKMQPLELHFGGIPFMVIG